MSGIRDILTDVIRGRAGMFADTAVNLTTNKPLSVEIEQIQDIEANTLLGRDARESVVFHVLDRTAASDIALGTELAVLGAKFKILRRTDNPASPMVDFGAMKLTEHDT